MPFVTFLIMFTMLVQAIHRLVLQFIDTQYLFLRKEFAILLIVFLTQVKDGSAALKAFLKSVP